MSPGPRHAGDYGGRQVEAARRVLVDVGQVLASFRDAIAVVAADWKSRRDNPLVATAIDVLAEKFKTVNDDGSQQLPVFHGSTDGDERAMHARRAFELVQKLLRLV